MSNRPALLSLPLLLALAPALAQSGGKKLYCWDDDKGNRVCGDTVSGEDLQRERQELNTQGRVTAQVGRALTEEERAAQDAEAERLRIEAAAAEARRRTEQALLTSYNNETELRKVFDEHVSILDYQIQTAAYNISGLRGGLVTLLQSAGEAELAGRPVPEKVQQDIRKLHADLSRNQAMKGDYQRRREALDVEIAATLQRFREIKGDNGPR